MSAQIIPFQMRLAPDELALRDLLARRYRTDGSDEWSYALEVLGSLDAMRGNGRCVAIAKQVERKGGPQ